MARQPQLALAEAGAEATVLALQGNYTAEQPKDPSYRWAARPLVAINDQGITAPGLAVNLAHELVHVVQKETYPLIEEPDLQAYQARNELEAYHISDILHNQAFGPSIILLWTALLKW